MSAKEVGILEALGLEGWAVETMVILVDHGVWCINICDCVVRRSTSMVDETIPHYRRLSFSSYENYLASTVFADLFLILIVFVFLLLIFAIANA